MLCFPTQIKVGTLYVKDHQVLRFEHRLGLMEILKNLKRYIFVYKNYKKNTNYFYSHGAMFSVPIT